MTDFSKILDKAKELEAKMKESQQKIKEIRVEGVRDSLNIIKDSILNGDLDKELAKRSKLIRSNFKK